MTTFTFYFFSTILLLAAVAVITVKNPVHAALALILSFFSAALLWLLIQAEFLAIVLVLVYVGAVMVLFLFVVMMLDINIEQWRRHFWRSLPLAMAVAVIMAIEMVMILAFPENGLEVFTKAIVLPAKQSNIQQLGMLIYTDYLLAFELAAVVLLVAMIAAIALTLRHRKHSKYQDPAKQVRVKRHQRIRLVKMAAEANKTQDNVASDHE